MLPKAYAPAGMYAPTYTGGGQTLASSGDPSIDCATSAFVTNVLSAGGMTLTTAESAILAQLITAASREMTRFMGGRKIPLQSYQELLSLENYGRQDRGEPMTAKLSFFPVVDVTRCATGRVSALLVSNSDSTTNQDAAVAFTTSGDVEFSAGLIYTGLTLTRWASGTQDTQTIAWTITSPYTTIQSVATSINALGNGWTATVQDSTLAGLPACRMVGARETKGALAPGCTLSVFNTPPRSFDIERRSGILRSWWGSAGFGGWGGAWGDPFGGGDGLGGGGYGGLGYGQIQVWYTAGFAVIPVDLQQVTAEIVKLAFDRLNRDSSLKSEDAGDYSYAVRDVWGMLPEWVYNTLTRYKDWQV